MKLSPLSGRDYTIESLYTHNEKGKGGFFPIGKNNCWHGGVHFFTCGYPVAAILGGSLAACYVPEENLHVPLKKKISERELKTDGAFAWHNKKTVGVAECYKCVKGTDINTYELKEEYSDAYKECSQGFILLKHTINNNFIFFTLYMHLAPHKDIPYISDFTHINTIIEGKGVIPALPFYYKWIFCLQDGCIPCNGEYGIRANKGASDGEEIVLLEYMYFEIKEEKCFYPNFVPPDKEHIQVLNKEGKMEDVYIKKNTLDIISGKIYLMKENTDEVSLYRSSNTNPQNKLAEAKRAGVLSGNEQINNIILKNRFANNTIEIELPSYSNGIEVNIQGFVYKSLVRSNGGKLKLDKNCNLIKISSVDCDGFYLTKIVMDNSGKIFTNDRSKDIFIKEEKELEGKLIGEKYFFVCNKKILSVTAINDDEFFNKCNSSNKLPVGIARIKCVMYKIEYPSGLYLYQGETIKEVNTPPRDVPKIENLLFVKYDIGNEPTRWYVDASKLKLEKGPCGRLKITEETKVPLARKGTLLFEQRNIGNDMTRITRDILEIGKEFEIANADAGVFINNTVKDYFFTVRDVKEKKILGLIDNQCILESNDFIRNNYMAKTVLIDGFKINELQTDKNINIPAQSILGYGGTMQNSAAFLHMGLFFKNDLPKNVKKNYYATADNAGKKPVLYQAEEKNINSYTTYIPPGTELRIKERSVTAKGAVKVCVSAIPVFIKLSDTTESDGKIVYKINKNILDSIILSDGNHRIYFNDKKNTSGDCKVLQEKLFGDEGGLLKENIFKRADSNIYDTYRYKLIIEPESVKSVTEWAFWIKDYDGDSEGIILFNEKAVALKIYEENPDIVKYGAAEYQGIMPAFLFGSGISVRNGYKNTAEKKETIEFYETTINGKNYGIEKDGLGGCERTEIRWEDFFNIQDKDDNNDIICDIPELVSKVDRGDSNGEGKDDKKICGSELVNIFNKRDNIENKKIVEGLRRMLCKFPFEFNRELYENDEKYRDKLRKLGYRNDEDSIAQIKNLMKGLDIWTGIKNIKGIDTAEKLWFGHPIYTLDVFDKLGLLEINPYLGKTFGNGKPTRVTVVNNPGFAPIGTAIEFGDKNFCAPDETGLFNEDYSPYYNNQTHYHTGIDFPTGAVGTDIMSFIYGTVWACTWNGTLDTNLPFSQKRGYGNVMIIKDINSDMLYVLGHLNDFCGMKLGTPVSPGQFVAKVGNTGKSSGPHLHLEARVCNGRTEMQNVLVKDSNNSYGNGPGLAFRADGQYSFPKEVNPFDFSIPLKQQKTDLR